MIDCLRLDGVCQGFPRHSRAGAEMLPIEIFVREMGENVEHTETEKERNIIRMKIRTLGQREIVFVPSTCGTNRGKGRPKIISKRRDKKSENSVTKRLCSHFTLPLFDTLSFFFRTLNTTQ